MTLGKSGYLPRIVDLSLRNNLKLFGAVNLIGPKWCGKTWSALNCCNSAVFFADPKNNYQNRRYALTDPNLIFNNKTPQLLDEWQDVPSLWDAVRYKIDETGSKGLFVLTGSATPNRSSYVHSGIGRIIDLKMETMTLFERGLSSGQVSLSRLFDLPQISLVTGEVELRDVIEYTIHGGWPGTLGMKSKDSIKVASGYIETLAYKDIVFDGKSRNPDTALRLIRSLARNESTIATKKTLCSDMRENPEDSIISPNTLDDYLSVLDALHFTAFQPAFDPNMRSSVRVGKTPKRHLVDPSLVCSALHSDVDQYIDDLNSFGYLFEALCVHDLRVYSSVIGGAVKHYRDGNGNEIDAVVELPDGRWGAFDIKTGANEIDAGARSLLAVSEKIQNQPNGRLPTFLCVICGMTDAAYVRPDGVYVVPPTVLSP